VHGQHSVEILTSLGYGQDAIATLARDRTIGVAG
jgi:hypothetical protein